MRNSILALIFTADSNLFTHQDKDQKSKIDFCRMQELKKLTKLVRFTRHERPSHSTRRSRDFGILQIIFAKVSIETCPIFVQPIRASNIKDLFLVGMNVLILRFCTAKVRFDVDPDYRYRGINVQNWLLL